MKLNYFLFHLLLGYSLANAQSFFVVSQRDVPLVNKTFIMNVGSCDSTEVYTCPPTNNTLQYPENQYTDIAVNGKDVFYCSGWGSLYKRSLNATSCQYLGTFNYGINAMVADTAGTLYATGQQSGIAKLFKYQAGNFVVIGNLPSGFFSSGDLFFYSNRLFMTGTSSNISSFYMVEIDINNPSQSCFYMSLPNYQPWSAFCTDSNGTSRVFILGVTPSNKTSTLYEVNMLAKTSGPPICTYPFMCNGAGSYYNLNAGISLCNQVISTNQENATYNPSLFSIVSPATEQIIIHTNIQPQEIMYLELFNSEGAKVRTFPVEEITTGMNVVDLPAGVYILKLGTRVGTVFTDKFIKTVR